MDAKTTVQTLLDSVQNAEYDRARTLLSHDFQFSGSTPEPINRDTWLRMNRSLKKAFPDLDYRFRVEGVDGDVIRVTAKLKGTHTNDLDISVMDMGVIPATQKSIIHPNERGKVTVKDGKVINWAVEPIAGGGLRGILIQLGVKSTGD